MSHAGPSLQRYRALCAASVRTSSKRSRRLAMCGVMLLLAGCVLAPEGTDAERQRVSEAGAAWAAPVADRVLPDLPLDPGWPDVLRHALLANGALEAAWNEWGMALYRIDIVSSWPNTNVMLRFETLLGEKGKAWDSSTVGVGFDPMDMLALPNKLHTKGEVALGEARAAGERFRAAKFSLQRRVLDAWLDWSLLAERTRIMEEQVRLWRLARESAGARLRAGGPQQDLLSAGLEFDMAENELRNVQAEELQSRATLNGLVGRPADAPLSPPRALPPPRPAPADAAIFVAAATGNPELSALAHDASARQAAIESARQRYLPDISPFFAASGGGPEMLGAGLSLPVTLPAIRASIAEAQAALSATEATARQTHLDVGVSVICALLALHNHERQIALAEGALLPTSERLVTAAQSYYATGAVGFADVLLARRALLDVRLLLAESRIGRERRLAELEELAGVDLETLLPDRSSPHE